MRTLWLKWFRVSILFVLLGSHNYVEVQVAHLDMNVLTIVQESEIAYTQE